MKTSKYNIIIEDNSQNLFLIFNSLTESLIALKSNYSNDVNILRTYKLNRIEEQLSFSIDFLKKGGFIVEDNFTEDEYLKFNANTFNYQNDTLFLILIPTLNCNFDCIYCKEIQREEKYSESDITSIIKYVELAMKKKKNLEIEWYGGEPLLEIKTIKKLTKAFQKICEENKAYYYASLCTNGSLFTDKIIYELKDLSISTIQITIDGPKITHEKLRPMKNGSESFDLIVENIAKIIMCHNEINIQLRVNVCNDNIDLLMNLFSSIPDSIKSNIKLYFRYIFSSESKNYKKFNKNLNWEKYWNLYLASMDYGINSFDICSSFLNKRKNFFYCYETERYSSMYIAPKCFLFKCSQSFPENESFGQLMKDGKIHYSNYKNYIDFCSVKIFDRETCKKCIYLPLHFGGCRSNYLKYNNSCQDDSEIYYSEMIKYYFKYFKKKYAPKLDNFEYLIIKLNQHILSDTL